MNETVIAWEFNVEGEQGSETDEGLSLLEPPRQADVVPLLVPI